jgi:hypothetical protein
MQQPPGPPNSFQPLAALLAFLLPGAGHAFLGYRRRGLYIGLGVFALFLSGLLIAGINAVDSANLVANRWKALTAAFTGRTPELLPSEGEPIWFLGQAFVGPTAFLVDALHQSRFKVVVRQHDPVADPADRRPPVPYLRAAHPYEIRDPRTGGPVRVRDPRTGEPLLFTDPATGQPRLSTLADRPPKVRALGRVEELGTLFCTVAGLLNLIAIIDAAWNHRRRDRFPAPSTDAPPSPPPPPPAPPPPAPTPGGAA